MINIKIIDLKMLSVYTKTNHFLSHKFKEHIDCRDVKLSSWRAGALQSLAPTLIKHTWSS